MSRRKLLVKVAKQYHNRVGECRLRAMVAKQEDLAKMTGISRSTINALENNPLFLSSPYALLIAEALGCRLDDLCGRRNAKGSLTPREESQGA
ncbi:MAG: helix-turn-helix transcriptional regulator [Caldisericum sp.]|uniref:helix-turn-helix transcriptional regulator n=1 Tax=Caldisericum sp. TaxID=2499687 RepID=UPI003D0D6D7F